MGCQANVASRMFWRGSRLCSRSLASCTEDSLSRITALVISNPVRPRYLESSMEDHHDLSALVSFTRVTRVRRIFGEGRRGSEVRLLQPCSDVVLRSAARKSRHNGAGISRCQNNVRSVEIHDFFNVVGLWLRVPGGIFNPLVLLTSLANTGRYFII